MVNPPEPVVTAPAGPAPRLRLHTDTGICAGAGRCVRAAPDLFDQDEDGLVVLLAADVPEHAPARAGSRRLVPLGRRLRARTPLICAAPRPCRLPAPPAPM